MACDVHHGDCRDVLRTLPDEAFAACVTDPPYHLTSIVKRFGGANAAPAKHGTDGAFARASRGFMGKTWDGGDIAQDPAMWAEVLRVLKPGAHLAAFGGTRTFHRMACAIEDAGFEIRDTLMWVYGTGFPKSLDVSKAIDKAAGAERAVVCTSPYASNCVGGRENTYKGREEYRLGSGADITAPATPEAAQWAGWGTALKPSFKPIILARKPLAGTVAANVLAHGCGAINVDACRVATDEVRSAGGSRRSGGIMGASEPLGGWQSPPGLGRWPANVLHDGSPEVEAAFAAFGESKSPASYVRGANVENGLYAGTASRFFYSAKASKRDRAGSKHPTVKPLSLMSWLCKLVTPPGGAILDPFAGSGTTLQAAMECGFSAVGIEREREYVADIKRRLKNANPLFAEVAA